MNAITSLHPSRMFSREALLFAGTFTAYVALAGLLLFSVAAIATTGEGGSGEASGTATALGEIYTWLKDLSTGTGGLLISLVVFIIGLVMGAIRTTAIYAIAGFVFAIMFKFGPGMLEGVMGASSIATSLATIGAF